MTRSTPPGFFDAISGGPLSDVARRALLQGVDIGWANPGRLYHPGRSANQLLNAARESCARELGFAANEIVFVQSAPLAFRLALAGLLGAETSVVSSAVEQSFLLDYLASLNQDHVSLIGVDATGRVDVAAFQSALDKADVAILQLANHEVGTRQPWEQIDFGNSAALTWIADATTSAAFGPVPERVDVAVVSPVSWGGPLGLAILCLRNRVRYSLSIGQGEAARDGAELQKLLGEPNVGLALASAASLEDFASRRTEVSADLLRLSTHLRQRLIAEVPDIALLGQTDASFGVNQSMPGLVSFSLLYIDGEALLGELAKSDISVTSGSSCVSDAVGPSHVLAAMGVLSQGNIRVSIPEGLTVEDIDHLADQIAQAVVRLRANAGVIDL